MTDQDLKDWKMLLWEYALSIPVEQIDNATRAIAGDSKAQARFIKKYIKGKTLYREKPVDSKLNESGLRF